MWFDGSLDLLEMLKSSFPVTFCVILPLLLVISPVNGAQNFPVYRVNQFDLASNTYGSRSTLVNMEARAINSGALTRKCIVTRLSDLTLTVYRHVSDQNAGALLILLPAELDKLSDELKQQFLTIERAMLTEETIIPVYFATESEETLDIYHQIKSASNADGSATATEALLQSVSANGFQMNVHVNAPKRLDKHKTINIHGVLEGAGNAERLPTILIVAHYDSMSVAPGLSFGADSNGSGVAALLELMRVFARLYNSGSRPSHNIAFLLSGAGKLNFFGTKKWLEEMKDSNNFPYINEVESVICLDTLGSDSAKLHVHVSKPPRDGSANALFLKSLEATAAEMKSSVEMVHKKIYLGDPQLAWEHEQFAMNKLAGMTISSLDSHKSPLRTSALDIKSSMDMKALNTNINIVGEALARYLYELPPSNDSTQQIKILSSDLAIQPTMVDAWLALLTSQPRAAQFMDKESTIVSSLEHAFKRHLKSVATTSYACDKRDPEFGLYDTSMETMHVYSVKPAVFDLVLALVIAAYLGVVYSVSLVYPSFAATLMNKQKKA